MLVNCKVNNFRILDQIGSGAYGLVFHVVNTTTNKQFAMKTILKSPLFSDSLNSSDSINRTSLIESELYDFFSNFNFNVTLPVTELDTIKNLSPEELEKKPHYKEISSHLKVQLHRGVVTIRQVIECTEITFIIMDYYPNDLFTAIVDQEHFANNGIGIKKVFLQLCSTIEYCHYMGVYHCDIKPENILLDEDDNVYLCDFGLSTSTKFLSPNVNVGSSYYMAPERILYYNHNSTSQDSSELSKFPTYNADVWSLGILLINLTCIRNPWLKAHQTEDPTFQYFVKDPTILKKILPISDELYVVLASILQINPHNRISLVLLLDMIKNLTSFTTSGPLSTVPVLPDSSYNNYVAVNLTDDSNINNNLKDSGKSSTSIVSVATNNANVDGSELTISSSERTLFEHFQNPSNCSSQIFKRKLSKELLPNLNKLDSTSASIFTSSLDDTPYTSDSEDLIMPRSSGNYLQFPDKISNVQADLFQSTK